MGQHHHHSVGGESPLQGVESARKAPSSACKSTQESRQVSQLPDKLLCPWKRQAGPAGLSRAARLCFRLRGLGTLEGSASFLPSQLGKGDSS